MSHRALPYKKDFSLKLHIWKLSIIKNAQSHATAIGAIILKGFDWFEGSAKVDVAIVVPQWLYENALRNRWFETVR